MRADGDEENLQESWRLELKNTKTSKKKLFQKWKEITDTELEKGRNLDKDAGKEIPVDVMTTPNAEPTTTSMTDDTTSASSI